MSFFGSRRQIETPPPEPRSETPPPAPPIPQTPVGFETVLGANSVMEGVLRSNANVRLDGTFSGTLEITGNVLIGETARINADVNAKNISIAGAVRGNITGKKVQLLRTGRIWGDIRATALTTEEGAFIDGKITMVGYDQPAVEAEPVAAIDEAPEAVVEALETPEEPDDEVVAVAEPVAYESVIADPYADDVQDTAEDMMDTDVRDDETAE
ncbi:MAG: polymer-forming cytoskeletal protein [Anaerolineae bacterium]|nr:polymer-forming cytoskeletal protein [Anaerolineae bacterium]